MYDATGAAVLSKNVYPNAATFDLSQIVLPFETLDVGKYSYKVFASAANTTAKLLITQPFEVTAAPAPEDLLTMTGGTVMADITKGSAVSVQGQITSAVSDILRVTVGIYDANGNQVTGGTAEPNARTYDLSALDAQVAFDQLEAGTYEYRVTASNAAHTDHILVNQYFRVREPEADALLLNSRAVIPNLICGDCIRLSGTVESSDSNITELIAGVYDVSGAPVKERFLTPNAQTYELHDLDTKTLLADLAPGTYYFRISAANSTYIDKILMNRTFTVSELAK